ncbi:MAG: hypothetical protein H6922_00580 [Pseudomonadaceae bacterium]|nr:hypothetical protein [Pseudomonadaceae bacterium]
MRLALILVLMLLATAAHAEVLTYQGSNRWVAQADAAPLRALTTKAKKGTTHFTVQLPEQHRKLAVERLEILRHILETAAGKGITLEEVQGTSPASTLTVIAD